MKKIVSLLLVFVLIFTLCACGNTIENSVNETTNTASNIISSNISDENQNNSSKTDINDEDADNDTSSNNTSNQKPSTTTKPDSTSNNIDIDNTKDDDKIIDNQTKPNIPQTDTTSTPSQDVIIDNVETDKPIDIGDAPITPEIKEDISISTEHNVLSQTEYYQYSRLTTTEKEIYNNINNAIKNTENIINVSSYDFKVKECSKVIQCFFADNPQYFYVSKYTKISYGSNDKAYNIFLYYTDGTTTDEFNNDFKTLKTIANRDTIANQIKEFNDKVTEIITNIPVDIEDYEKEKIIHDYIVDNIVYNFDIVSETFANKDVLPHDFDVYGALVENKAVCEGFAKIFQYLCYNVGINANQVIGDANGPHMWNVVKIQEQWYQMDVTWDTTCSSNLKYNGYYNLTTSDILKDHTIDTTNLFVPECNASQYSFQSLYAVTINDINTPPVNIEKIADRINDNIEEEFLLIYTEDVSIITMAYLKDNFYLKSSVWNNYLKSKEYTYKLATTYTVIGNYIYIPVSRQ